MDKNEQMEMNELLLRLQSIAERVGQIADLVRRGELNLAKTEMDELYMESVESDSQKLGSRIEQMIEHLLKLAYCDNYHYIRRDARGWVISVKKQKKSLYSSLRWGEKKRKTNIINSIKSRMQEIYNNGVYAYNLAIDENSSLESNSVIIPKNCPWSLENLMDEGIVTLVEMLDGHTEFYRQYAESREYKYPSYKLNLQSIIDSDSDDDFDEW
nr:MAG TPA: protein of unknown function DUF29 [Caudoviricetes sp.]